jgi:hypothetical protein
MNSESPNTPSSSHRIHRQFVGAIVGVALFLTVFCFSDLEMGIGNASFSIFHFIIAAIIVLLTTYLFTPKNRKKAIEQDQGGFQKTAPGENHIPLLAVAALIAGPATGFAGGLLIAIISQDARQDWFPVTTAITILGSVVGAFVAAVLGVAARLK